MEEPNILPLRDREPTPALKLMLATAGRYGINCSSPGTIQLLTEFAQVCEGMRERIAEVLNTRLHSHQLDKLVEMLTQDHLNELLDDVHLPRGGILGDEMGTGKTLMAIAYAAAAKLLAKDAGKEQAPVLIIASTTLFNQVWTPQLKKHISYETIYTVNKSNAKQNIAQVPDFVFADIEVLKGSNDTKLMPLLCNTVWRSVIIDEAHHAPATGSFFPNYAAIPAESRFVMTGTPMRKPEDLNNLVRLVDINNCFKALCKNKDGPDAITALMTRNTLDQLSRENPAYYIATPIMSALTIDLSAAHTAYLDLIQGMKTKSGKKMNGLTMHGVLMQLLAAWADPLAHVDKLLKLLGGAAPSLNTPPKTRSSRGKKKVAKKEAAEAAAEAKDEDDEDEDYAVEGKKRGRNSGQTQELLENKNNLISSRGQMLADYTDNGKALYMAPVVKAIVTELGELRKNGQKPRFVVFANTNDEIANINA